MTNKKEISEYQLTLIFNKLEEAKADFEIALSESENPIAHDNYVQGKANLIQLQKMILNIKNKR